MRHYRIDELPQLIDVIAGHMSLVGPRPEVPRFVALYPAALREQVLSVRPGLTDPASLEFVDEAATLTSMEDAERHYVEHILPRKLRRQAHTRNPRVWRRTWRCWRARCAWCWPGSGPHRERHQGRALGATAARGPQGLTVWHRFDRFMATMRPQREPLSLVVDAVHRRL